MRLLLLPLLLAATSPAQADLLLVPDQYPSVKAAVNAAVDGDTVLVTSPLHGPGFTINGKSVDVYGGGSTLSGAIVIRNLGLSDSVVLSGFAQTTFGIERGISINDSIGDVHIQDCLFRGANGSLGSRAASVDLGRVTFKNCQLLGGNGSLSSPLKAGSRALVILSGSVTLTDCVLAGGSGGNASGSPCTPGGDGGNAISVISSGQVLTVGCSITGGAPGAAGQGCEAGEQGFAAWNPTSIGTIRSLGDTLSGATLGFTTLSGAPRLLSMGTQAAPGSSLTAQIDGLPGDSVLLLSSSLTDSRFLPFLGSTLELGQPLTVVDTLTLDASGQAQRDISIPDLPLGMTHLSLGFQVLAFPNGQPARHLSNGRWVLVH